MLEAEKRVNLAAVVGAKNVEYYRVDSGTSYAAGNITQALCFVHQMTQLVRAYADAQGESTVRLRPFVRAYIDEAVDREHPAMYQRLADRGLQFGGLVVPLDGARRQQYFSIMTGSAVDLRIRYSTAVAVRFLRAIARDVPNVSRRDSGYGFVSREAGAKYVREARFSSLIELFGGVRVRKAAEWRAAFAKGGDPRLFTDKESKGIEEYCEKFDLILSIDFESPSRRSGRPQ